MTGGGLCVNWFVVTVLYSVQSWRAAKSGRILHEIKEIIKTIKRKEIFMFYFKFKKCFYRSNALTSTSVFTCGCVFLRLRFGSP